MTLGKNEITNQQTTHYIGQTIRQHSFLTIPYTCSIFSNLLRTT